VNKDKENSMPYTIILNLCLDSHETKNNKTKQTSKLTSREGFEQKPRRRRENKNTELSERKKEEKNI